MIVVKDKQGISKMGNRSNNEDFILGEKTDCRVAVLCDGMGGHGHGEVASLTVANVVFDYLCAFPDDAEYSPDDLQAALEAAVDKLNEADVFDDERKMGTTIVVTAINKDKILVGHVGDSRFYLFDELGMKVFKTKDHSKVAEAVDAGILTEEEAYNSEYKNILTRCVMAGRPTPKMDIDEIEIQGDERIMLCSDGVIDALTDNQLQEILMNRSISGALAIIDSKCSENSHDNYSIIIADVHDEREKQQYKDVIPGKNPAKIVDPLNKGKCEDEMLKCPRCGAMNEAGANFCRNCRQRLTRDTVVCGSFKYRIKECMQFSHIKLLLFCFLLISFILILAVIAFYSCRIRLSLLF